MQRRTSILLGIPFPVMAVVGALWAAPDSKPGEGCGKGPARVRLEAESTTYDMEKRILDVEAVTATLTGPCTDSVYTLKAPVGAYDEKSGTLVFRGGLDLQGKDLKARAKEGMLEAKTSVARLMGNLELTGMVKNEEGKSQEAVIKAHSALLDMESGDFEAKGPITARSGDYNAMTDLAKGNLKTGKMHLCCDLTLNQKDNQFFVSEANLELKTKSFTAPGIFRLRYAFPKSKVAPKPAKPAAESKSVLRLPALSGSFKQAELRGKELRYNGETGRVTSQGSMHIAIDGDEGEGTVGSFTGDLNEGRFDFSKGVALRLGTTSFKAEGGVFENAKRLLTLQGGLTLVDEAPEGDRTLKAKSGQISFRPEGALVTLYGGVALDLVIPPDALSGSLKL